LSVKYSRYITAISIAGDFVILNLLFVAGYCYFFSERDCFSREKFPFYLFINVVWLILVFSFSADKISRNTPKKAILFTYIKLVVFSFFIFLLYFQLFTFNYYPRDTLKYLFPLFFLLLIAWKFFLDFLFFLYRKKGYNFRNVIIVGQSPKSQELAKYFSHTKWNGYRFLGIIDEKVDKKLRVVEEFSNLRSFIENQQVDEIYLNLDNISKEHRKHVSEVIMDFPLKVRLIQDYGEFSNFRAELVNYDFVPVLQIHPGPLSYWYNKLMKRIFDVVFSFLIIIFVLSWITGILYILSLFNGREGVFFKQKRTGTDGKVFTCFKFRTMLRNPDADLQKAVANDKRVMPVGRLLRKTGLDELPQFINVLLGQMSVVGPRPHMLKHTEQYRKMVRKFMMRHTIKPGITGLAQVRGFRGEIRKISELKQRIQLDVSYIENWSFMLDVRIVFLTVVNFFRGQEKAY